MAPNEIQILAQVKPALRWLGLNAARNSKPDVHRLDLLSGASSKAGLKQPIAASMVRISLRVMAVHVQETPLVFFQHKAGQAAGRIPGSVDSDPIGANLRD